MSWQDNVPPRVLDAMWSGKTEWLDKHYRCQCCCYEHFSLGCPAQVWHGCRGSTEAIEQRDEERYFELYGEPD